MNGAFVFGGVDAEEQAGRVEAIGDDDVKWGHGDISSESHRLQNNDKSDLKLTSARSIVFNGMEMVRERRNDENKNST